MLPSPLDKGRIRISEGPAQQANRVALLRVVPISLLALIITLDISLFTLITLIRKLLAFAVLARFQIACTLAYELILGGAFSLHRVCSGHVFLIVFTARSWFAETARFAGFIVHVCLTGVRKVLFVCLLFVVVVVVVS